MTSDAELGDHAQYAVGRFIGTLFRLGLIEPGDFAGQAHALWVLIQTTEEHRQELLRARTRQMENPPHG